MRILLIEPDKVLASTYCQALEQVGHVVDMVYDAQGAIDAADAHSPELVILELQLIEHNGIEFLYEFRSYAEWQQVPVIVHSWVPPNARVGQSLAQLRVAAYHYKPQTTLRRLLASANEVVAPAA